MKNSPVAYMHNTWETEIPAHPKPAINASSAHLPGLSKKDHTFVIGYKSTCKQQTYERKPEKQIPYFTWPNAGIRMTKPKI